MGVVINADMNEVDEKYRPMIKRAIDKARPVLQGYAFVGILHDELIEARKNNGELGDLKDANALTIYLRLFDTVNDEKRISLHLRTYYSFKRVIGFGVAGTRVISLNTKYLSGYDMEDMNDLMKIFSNLLHEHSHDRGMEHDFKNTSRRKNSLSYILNRVYEQAFRQYYWSNLDYTMWLAEGREESIDKYYKLPWYRAILPWNWR